MTSYIVTVADGYFWGNDRIRVISTHEKKSVAFEAIRKRNKNSLNMCAVRLGKNLKVGDMLPAMSPTEIAKAFPQIKD